MQAVLSDCHPNPFICGPCFEAISEPIAKSNYLCASMESSELEVGKEIVLCATSGF